MTITRMLGLRHLLGKPVSRRTAVVAAGARFAALLGTPPPAPRLLACGWCYEENGEEVHPHPECPIGQPTPAVEKCCRCGSTAAGYHNYRDQPFCWPCANDDDGLDTRIAASEAEGRIARTTERLERLAAELDARHQRYAWTEQLRQDLLAIAHDTPPSVGG